MTELAWLTLTTAVALAVNVVVLIWQAWQVRRYWRLTEQTVALDTLLMHLCVRSFQMWNAPIFQAWSQSMGHINVEVRAVRDAPPDDAR